MSEFLPLAAWSTLWIIGGVWLVRRVFRLACHEQWVIGIVVGLTLENLAANILGRFLPLGVAAWLAAGLVLVLGLAVSWRQGWRNLIRLPWTPWQWLVLVLLAALFTGINRGLGIFDDYAHLPTLSLIAAGDIPPQFPLDPAVTYNYHYFLMLFAAQIMRVGSQMAWTALDVARGLSLSLAMLAGALFSWRITQRKLAGFVAALVVAFGMGTRWLLLALPASVVQWISPAIERIGSGATGASEFSLALLSTWGVDSGGPLPFPFAFANGIYAPGVIGMLGPNGTISMALAFVFLLLHNRWDDWRGGAVLTALIASTSLLGEGSPLLLAAWGLVTLVWIMQHHTWRLPRSLWRWLAVFTGGTLLGMLQGGAFLDILLNALNPARTSYQTVGFEFLWPPAVVSAHLGVLSLVDPRTLIVALLEIGPVLLAAPLVVRWGIKSYRSGRWYEAALITSGVITIGVLLVQFSGSTGVRNTSRLYEFIGLCALLAVPAVWMWVSGRSDTIKILVILPAVLMMVGGAALFSAELPATQKPLLAKFISVADARMAEKYWDKLEPGALVFDPEPSRSPTIFGRPTDSSTTWYERKPAWEKLRAAPDLHALRAAGFSYAYFDNKYTEELTPENRQLLQDGCARLVAEMQYKLTFSTLLDLRGCTR